MEWWIGPHGTCQTNFGINQRCIWQDPIGPWVWASIQWFEQVLGESPIPRVPSMDTDELRFLGMNNKSFSGCVQRLDSLKDWLQQRPRVVATSLPGSRPGEDSIVLVTEPADMFWTCLKKVLKHTKAAKFMKPTDIVAAEGCTPTSGVNCWCLIPQKYPWSSFLVAKELYQPLLITQDCNEPMISFASMIAC